MADGKETCHLRDLAGPHHTLRKLLSNPCPMAMNTLVSEINDIADALSKKHNVPKVSGRQLILSEKSFALLAFPPPCKHLLSIT